jgi:hypothetical protein
MRGLDDERAYADRCRQARSELAAERQRPGLTSPVS